jgi:Flp pilus assembly secretin CpaC
MIIRSFALCAVLVAVVSTAAEEIARPNPVPTTSPEVSGISPTPAPISACNQGVQQASTCNSGCKKRASRQALLQQKLAELNCLQTEIDELRRATGTPQQILVKLQVLEISRTKLRQPESDFAALEGETLTTTTKRIDSLLQNSGSGFGIIDDGDAYLAFMDLLQQNNIGRVLANPQIITLNGEPARFNVGGELPLPATPGSNQPVQFREYGTQADLVAKTIGDSRVRLDLCVRISDVDDSRSIDVAGSKVPALHVRQCAAAIELEFGQTGVVSGLAQQRVEKRKFEGRIEDHVDDIELLFLVTPEAVHPTATKPRGSQRNGATDDKAAPASDETRAVRSARVPEVDTPQ